MELIQFAHLTPGFIDPGYWSDFSQAWIGHLNFGGFGGFDGFELNGALLGQQFDTDVFATTRKIVGEFIKSGKLWTLMIGVVIGYVLKGLTSYG